MASIEEDSERLKGALAVDDVEQRIVELENTLKSVSKRNESLQIDLEKERAEKQTLAEAKAAAEKSKAEAVEKLEDLSVSERRLRERETSNLESLSQQRETLNKTQQELNLSRQTIIQNAVEIEKMSSLVNTLTTDKRSLKSKLEDTESQIESLNSQIRHLQSSYDTVKEESKSQRNKLVQQINDLQAEKNQLIDQAEQLKLQLDHARSRVNEVELKLEELAQKNNMLELNLGSTTKAYKELEQIYNEYTVDTHKKVATFESRIQVVNSEKEDLVALNKDLQVQLLQEQELRKANFGQMTGVTESANNGKPAGNLLRLIQEYRDLERRPEDIFQDYFDLREKYNNAINSNSLLNNTVETLSRKQHESDVKFDRLYREMKATAQKNATIAKDLKSQQDASKQISADKAKLQAKFDALQKEKEDLQATLNDTTYQLQHLLAQVQKRNEPIPAELKESAALLRGAVITPTIPHNQLVFSNIAQLQDVNKELTMEVRMLNNQLREAQNKISSAEITRNSDTTVYTTALDEAKRTTSDLSEKVKKLQYKLDMTTTECNNYKRIVSELGDGDANTKFQQMQETQNRQREEMDITLEAYRKETLEEINKLKEELFHCRESERDAKKNLVHLTTEKRNLIHKIDQMSSQSERIELESKTLGRNNSLLQDRLFQKDQELTALNKDIAEYKTRVELLSEEKNSLQARYEATASAYQDLKENITRESSEKSQMVSLLEALQSRLDISSTLNSNSNEQSLETVERLNRELQHARDTLAATEKQLDHYKSIDQTEIQDKYKESVIEIRLLKAKIAEIEQKLSDVNQERIIAQTKLVVAEEQLKSALASTDNASPDAAAASATCEEHVRLLAVAEDRVRVLENDNTAYQTIIAEKEKLIAANHADHDELINKTQATIDKLLKDIEERNASVQVAQQEAEKSITEYNALREKFVASQAEISSEKATLQEKIKALNADVTSKQLEIIDLKESIEEKTTALTEALAKLESETKIAEEQKQTINSLRSDVSNLTFEISQYKNTIAAASATETHLRTELEHAINERSASDESWKSKFATINKQQEELAQSVTDLIAKHAEWAAANDKQNGPERAGFMATTEEIVKQLREANETLRIEKDACELNYQNERNKLRRKENELENVQTQVASLRADISRLREDNKALLERSTSDTVSDKMQYEAFKVQNQKLIMENNELREAKQKALAAQAKMEAEISPLQVKIDSLEAELAQANAELVVLQKGQKEWTARSAKLLSKYNRVDPAEIENVKAELETTKAELEALKAEKITVDSTVEQLQATMKTNETERTSLVQKANERGRMAIDFKKKWMAASAKLEELTKKAESADSTNASKADLQKLTQEKEALEAQLKTLEEAKTKLDEANKAAEAAKTTAETALAKKQEEADKKAEEHSALEKKYHLILKKARQVQIEKNNVSKELETLKKAQTNGAAATDNTARITELEEELATLRKQFNEQSVELNRYKAQLSMAQNKSNRLQKEVETLKAQKPSTSTLSPTAPAFQFGSSPVSSPRIPAENGSAPISPAPATRAKSPVLAAKSTLLKKAITSNVNTPELSSTPAPASVDTPILTPVTTPAPQEEEEPVMTEDPSNEEAAPATPEVSTPAETVEEADLSMQVDSDLADDGELGKPSHDDEVPVDVEVHIESENPKSPSPAPEAEADNIEELVRQDEENTTTTTAAAASLVQLQDAEEDATLEAHVTESNAAETSTTEADVIEINATEATEVNTTEANTAEENGTEETTAQDNTPEDSTVEDAATTAETEDKLNEEAHDPVVVTGIKRERDEDEEDLSGVESPTKKAQQ